MGLVEWDVGGVQEGFHDGVLEGCMMY